MDALEALEQFKKQGGSKLVRKFKPTPTLKFDKKGGEYVYGVLQRYKELKGSKAGKSVVELKLIDTNGRFTIQGDQEGEYLPIEVKAGDKVSLFAPTDLDNFIKNVPIGTEIFIISQGKTKENRDGKVVESYKFDVRSR